MQRPVYNDDVGLHCVQHQPTRERRGMPQFRSSVGWGEQRDQRFHVFSTVGGGEQRYPKRFPC